MPIRRPPTTFSDEINAADLAANSVTASELADNAVDTAAIADDAVTNAKVGASAIGATELASNAVTTAKITDANITSAKVASSAITKEKIAAEAIEVKPHIKYGMLYPAMKDTGGTVRLSDGVTAHSGTVYGTAQSDGKSYYYTDIKGSKPIKDPRIGAYFGSQRHKFKSLQLLEQETATHGSDVYSVDGREWVRGVGTLSTNNDTRGQFINIGADNTSSAFIEITGYFNDVNLLMFNEASRSGYDYAINGTTATTNDTQFTTPSTSPLDGRYVDAQSVHNIAIGTITTPNIHTLKITKNTTTANGKGQCSGIELIAQDTTDTTRKNHVNIPAQNVVSYGKKFSVGSATLTNAVHKHYNPFAFKTDGTTAWASGTNNGTSFPVGTGSSHNIDTATSLGLENWKSGTDYYKPYNGGRVVRWVASDGTIKTSVTVMPPNARSIGNSGTLSNGTAKANASIANNTFYPTIEAGTTDDFPTTALTEVAKAFHWREFGNGSANGGTGATFADPSMLNTVADDITYVMDDGLTSFVGSSVKIQNITTYGGIRIDSNSKSLFFTFIGTGIKTIRQRDGSTTEEPVTWAQNLPYGTHILELQRDGSANQVAKIDGVTLETNSTTDKYLIHGSPTFFQPKKPPVPEDACILADYMLMADFVSQATSGVEHIPKGVRFQAQSRDYNIEKTAGTFLTGTFKSHDPNRRTGQYFWWKGAGTYTQELPFFGDSFVCHYSTENDSDYDNPVYTLNGSSLSGFTNTGHGSGFTSVTAAGVVTESGNTGADNVVNFKAGAGTLGSNTLKVSVTTSNSSHYLYNRSFSVVTPIHTSHHYQSFETPFLKELVGGDRNMEQTNLICTPDGKSWDEVTRDTSYLSNVKLRTNLGNEQNITNPLIFAEWRGKASGGDIDGIDKFNKDFAIGHGRLICLEQGNYQITWWVYVNMDDAAGGYTMYQNGAVIAQNYSAVPASGKTNVITVIASPYLSRGDYITMGGTSAISQQNFEIIKV